MRLDKLNDDIIYTGIHKLLLFFVTQFITFYSAAVETSEDNMLISLSFLNKRKNNFI